MEFAFITLSIILAFSGINSVRVGRNIGCIKSQGVCLYKAKSRKYVLLGFVALFLSLIILAKIV